MVTTYLPKGARIRARWARAYLPCLAGAQVKMGVDFIEITGIVRSYLMSCPCCDEPLSVHDTIEAGSAHRTLSQGTFVYTIWRCAHCADERPASCVCQDEGIYNDRDGELQDGYGCAL